MSIIDIVASILAVIVGKIVYCAATSLAVKWGMVAAAA